MQDQQIQQVVDSLQKANNIMVTVRNSPSLDELTAAIGLTLMLNNMDKHATTVFSGRVPSILEFLQPEMAIETNTDSLRDFIIALDKSKADKLRYKVEDDFVKIFITPYKTSIMQQDLQFSQGEFNVDVVVTLGVLGKDDFDQAILSHGRILHDAVIVGVTKGDVPSQVATMSWHDPLASSVSEMISSIAEMLGPNLMDGQIATALMTGIVAETDRFRNANTTPKVLALSSKLMIAGANQQLIATKLEEGVGVESPQPTTMLAPEDDVHGTLEIPHEDTGEYEIQDILIDDSGNMQVAEDNRFEESSGYGYDQDASNAQFDDQTSFADTEGPAIIAGQSSRLGFGERETQDQGYITSPPQTTTTMMADSQLEGSELSSALFQKEEFIDESTLESEDSQQEIDIPPTFKSPYQPPMKHHKVITPLLEEQGENQQPAISSIIDPEPQRQEYVAQESAPVQQAQQSSQNIDDYTGSSTTPLREKEESSTDNLPPPPKTENQVVNKVEAADLPPPPIAPNPVPNPVDSGMRSADLPPPPKSSNPVVNKVDAKDLPPPPSPERSAVSVGKPPAETRPAILAPKKDESKREETIEELEAMVSPPPPKVINPTSAPSVPPPITPPIKPVPSDQPQFFEADGSKSNPFLNPV